jgi:hypothetical protein
MPVSPAGQMRRATSSWRHTDPMEVPADPADVESVTVRYLMYVRLPALFVPGIADYVLHRRTRIERTRGLGNRRFTH